MANTIGLLAVAIGRLLTASSWTKLGSASENVVAKQLDKTGNGWGGFYYQNGTILLEALLKQDIKNYKRVKELRS